nr:hypothetical protein [Abalone asfa-like virus]
MIRARFHRKGLYNNWFEQGKKTNFVNQNELMKWVTAGYGTYWVLYSKDRLNSYIYILLNQPGSEFIGRRYVDNITDPFEKLIISIMESYRPKYKINHIIRDKFAPDQIDFDQDLEIKDINILKINYDLHEINNYLPIWSTSDRLMEFFTDLRLIPFIKAVINKKQINPVILTVTDEEVKTIIRFFTLLLSDISLDIKKASGYESKQIDIFKTRAALTIVTKVRFPSMVHAIRAQYQKPEQRSTEFYFDPSATIKIHVIDPSLDYRNFLLLVPSETDSTKNPLIEYDQMFNEIGQFLIKI